MGMSVYTSAGFRIGRAKDGTEQAKTRPVTLTGSGATIKYSPTDAQYAEWQAESDPVKRAAILAAGKSRTIATGKVQITLAGRDTWLTAMTAECSAANSAGRKAHDQAEAERIEALPKDAPDGLRKARPFSPILPEVYAAEVLAAGTVVLDNAADDDTSEVLADLFGDFAKRTAPEAGATPTA